MDIQNKEREVPHTVKLTKQDLENCATVKRLLANEKARSGMTQELLGKLIDKSSKTVSALTNGKMRITLEIGLSLARVFNVPVTEILPHLEGVGTKGASEVIDDYSELNQDNQEVARRLIRKLLESQEDV